MYYVFGFVSSLQLTVDGFAIDKMAAEVKVSIMSFISGVVYSQITVIYIALFTMQIVKAALQY